MPASTGALGRPNTGSDISFDQFIRRFFSVLNPTQLALWYSTYSPVIVGQGTGANSGVEFATFAGTVLSTVGTALTNVGGDTTISTGLTSLAALYTTWAGGTMPSANQFEALNSVFFPNTSGDLNAEGLNEVAYNYSTYARTLGAYLIWIAKFFADPATGPAAGTWFLYNTSGINVV